MQVNIKHFSSLSIHELQHELHITQTLLTSFRVNFPMSVEERWPQVVYMEEKINVLKTLILLET